MATFPMLQIREQSLGGSSMRTMALAWRAAFTVWCPTSREAKYQMMKGYVTGKGLDVKGKSARGGVRYLG